MERGASPARRNFCNNDPPDRIAGSNPAESIVELARELIAVPSQAGIDDPAAVLAVVRNWFGVKGVPGRMLLDQRGAPCGWYAEAGTRGPRFVLDACIDTAAAGDPASWTHQPFGAELEGDWLYGRGAGDSKIAVSLFSHLFQAWFAFLSRKALRNPIRLGVLFDADEHTGRFGGIKALLKEVPDIAGACIGYPGLDELVIGARGFYRVEAVLHGTAAHTGMPGRGGDNAAVRGAGFVLELGRRWEEFVSRLPPDSRFPFGPGLTVTGIHGGTAFSVVPDRCVIRIDIRLTGSCTAEQAARFFDGLMRAYPRSELELLDTWPAYALAPEDRLPEVLGRHAEVAVRKRIERVYCGPSNIGNFLASHGIPATCGFGVVCENFHAADERIRIDTVGPVYRAYEAMVRELAGEAAAGAADLTG